MKIVKAYPPNYELILVSGLKPDENTVFAYGDTIYNPSGKDIRPDIQYHEEVHSKQQGDNPSQWWTMYLQDKDFRLSQELQAYGEQYAFTKKHIKNAKLLKWGLEQMAFALSSNIYGNVVGYSEAESKIRNYGR